MSVYVNINTLCNDKILNDLVIPSCLFINPNKSNKQFHNLNLDDNLVIDEKIFNILLNSDTNNNIKQTKSNKKSQNKSNKKSKKNKN